MTLEEIRTFLLSEFAPVFAAGSGVSVDMAERGRARVRLSPSDRHLRPGSIVSGPTLMTVADCAAYAALLSLGEEAKMALTTSLTINFLRAARVGADVLTEAALLKPGRRLAVVECTSRSEGDETLIAHTVMTYAYPAA